jgi:hypothetical protein
MVNWFEGKYRGPARVTPVIQALADSLTRDAPSDSARIHRIAAYVQRSMEYEGGLFVEWGVTPRSAEVALRSRYGDCKDQSALVVAMLRATGARACPVLANVEIGRRLRYLPSSRFDHAIVRAETDGGQVYWIDTTERDLAFPDIPAGLEGREVLVVDPGLAEPVQRVTTDPPSANGHEIRSVLGLIDRDRFRLTGEARFRGEDAAFFRRLRRQDVSRVDPALRGWLGATYAGARIDSLELDLDSGTGARLVYDLEIPAEISRAGQFRLVAIPWMLPNSPEELASLESRRQPVVLGNWKGVYSEEIRFATPAGHALEGAPESRHLTCLNGDYRLEHDIVASDTLLLRRRLELRGLEVAVEDYPAFRSFVEEVAGIDREQLVLRATE